MAMGLKVGMLTQHNHECLLSSTLRREGRGGGGHVLWTMVISVLLPWSWYQMMVVVALGRRGYVCNNNIRGADVKALISVVRGGGALALI